MDRIENPVIDILLVSVDFLTFGRTDTLAPAAVPHVFRRHRGDAGCRQVADVTEAACDAFADASGHPHNDAGDVVPRRCLWLFAEAADIRSGCRCSGHHTRLPKAITPGGHFTDLPLVSSSSCR